MVNLPVAMGELLVQFEILTLQRGHAIGLPCEVLRLPGEVFLLPGEVLLLLAEHGLIAFAGFLKADKLGIHLIHNREVVKGFLQLKLGLFVFVGELGVLVGEAGMLILELSKLIHSCFQLIFKDFELISGGFQLLFGGAELIVEAADYGIADIVVHLRLVEGFLQGLNLCKALSISSFHAIEFLRRGVMGS